MQEIMFAIFHIWMNEKESKKEREREINESKNELL